MTDLETQPKSYYGLFVEHVECHYGAYGVALGLFCGVIFGLNTALLYHIHIAEIGWITAAEAEVGVRLAQEINMTVVYIRLVASFVGLVSAAMMIKRR